MRHLEEHKDLEPEPEEETELKIIQITNENKKSLLEQFDGEKAGSSGSGSGTMATTANSPTFVRNLIRAIESDPAKIASSKIKVSSTSLKLSERRYKCFWCDTSFRKRGKLMDHIDMFHKANKHQTELEAELLQGVSRDTSVFEPEKSKPTTNRQSNVSSLSSSVSSSNNKSTAGKDSGTTRSKSCEKPAHPAPPKPKKRCCLFNMVGSIREEFKVRSQPIAATKPPCKFYFGSCGDLPERKDADPEPSRSPSPACFAALDAVSPFSPTHVRQFRSTSISSNSSQPLSSPQTHAPSSAAAQFSKFSHRDTSFQPATHPFRQQPQLGTRNQPLAQPLFPHMSYYMPASDLYLNQQHNMIIEQQRSQLQYLSYMQSLVSQNAVDPNRPLDLSKATK